jgi:glucokinase
VTIVGIDVGGSKILAATVDVTTGEVLHELRIETPVRAGGHAVLETCVGLARELAPDGARAVGIGLCEFVDLSGTPTSAFTVDWRDLDVAGAFEGSERVRVESDVRAAALAEARFGKAAGFDSFIYLTVGSGVSHCLVLDGEPYAGSRGNAIVVGAPPVERTSGGLALAERAGVDRAELMLDDPGRALFVDEAAAALGLALGALVNALDPAAVVIGGGLGLVDRYRERVAEAARPAIEHEATRGLPILPATLGVRSGVIGAALAGFERPVPG